MAAQASCHHNALLPCPSCGRRRSRSGSRRTPVSPSTVPLATRCEPPTSWVRAGPWACGAGVLALSLRGRPRACPYDCCFQCVCSVAAAPTFLRYVLMAGLCCSLSPADCLARADGGRFAQHIQAAGAGQEGRDLPAFQQRNFLVGLQLLDLLEQRAQLAAAAGAAGQPDPAALDRVAAGLRRLAAFGAGGQPTQAEQLVEIFVEVRRWAVAGAGVDEACRLVREFCCRRMRPAPRVSCPELRASFCAEPCAPVSSALSAAPRPARPAGPRGPPGGAHGAAVCVRPAAGGRRRVHPAAAGLARRARHCAGSAGGGAGRRACGPALPGRGASRCSMPAAHLWWMWRRLGQGGLPWSRTPGIASLQLHVRAGCSGAGRRHRAPPRPALRRSARAPAAQCWQPCACCARTGAWRQPLWPRCANLFARRCLAGPAVARRRAALLRWPASAGCPSCGCCSCAPSWPCTHPACTCRPAWMPCQRRRQAWGGQGMRAGGCSALVGRAPCTALHKSLPLGTGDDVHFGTLLSHLLLHARPGDSPPAAGQPDACAR